MKRIAILFLLFVSASVFAQKQIGYVRTIQKANKPAVYLKGVEIITKENKNGTKSGKDGFFTIPVNAKDRKYTIISVKKDGYRLVDDYELDRPQECNLQSKTIVMIYKADEDKQTNALTEKLRKKIDEEYMNKLEAIRDSSSVEKDRLTRIYEQQIADLHDLVKRLVRLDYADLTDSLDYAAAQAYEEGDLEGAVEILRKRPPINERLELHKKKDDMRKKETEALIKECDMMIDYYKTKYRNDSVLFFMKMKLNLRPYKIDYMLDIGDFVYHYLADYDTALSYYNRALKKANGLDRVECNLRIGDMYEAKGNYDFAMREYNKALNMGLKLGGEKHPVVASCYHHIGSAFMQLDKFDTALVTVLKGFEIQKGIVRDDDKELLMCYNTLGSIYAEMGYYDSSIANYKKAIVLLDRSAYPRLRERAETTNNLGFAFHLKGDYDSALVMYKKSYEIKRKIYSEKHPLLASTCNNIGGVYSDIGNFDSACMYYSKALEARLATLGDNHPSVAESYHNLGCYLNEIGKNDSSMIFLNKAKTIWLSVYGEKHSHVAATYTYIGKVYEERGDFDSALFCYKKALNIRKNVFRETHPIITGSYNTIGNCFVKHLLYDSALFYYNKALEIRKTKLGETHQSTLSVKKSISMAEYELSLQKNTYPQFISNHCFSFSVSDGSSVALKGMSGEYVLLELDDWTQDSSSSVYKKIEEIKENSKTVVVLKDGVVQQFSFKGSIGAQIVVKEISKEEKQEINKAYNAWKKKNK